MAEAYATDEYLEEFLKGIELLGDDWLRHLRNVWEEERRKQWEEERWWYPTHG